MHGTDRPYRPRQSTQHNNREQQDWEQLNAALTLISKRRQQNKAAITAVVQEAMTYVDDAPGREAKRGLITTLRDITGACFTVRGFVCLDRAIDGPSGCKGPTDELRDPTRPCRSQQQTARSSWRRSAPA